ncbi:MAG TPA: TetR family transcriptional regulator [Devosiaceae bacterium]|nr:TetR family transcriptional regulator [Devosiaceae bacterium]
MPGDATETRKRLLEAATREFAQFGIAGARIDRIAEEASANKSLIYSYFGNKEELFSAVFDAQVVQTLEVVPIDASDLPEYAGRLFDYYCANPLVNRIAAWSRLERGEEGLQVEAIIRANSAKTQAIAAAQAAGHLSKRFPAPALLLLVLSNAGIWATMMPEYRATLAEYSPLDTAARRKIVVEATRLLIEQPATGD